MEMKRAGTRLEEEGARILCSMYCHHCVQTAEPLQSRHQTLLCVSSDAPLVVGLLVNQGKVKGLKITRAFSPHTPEHPKAVLRFLWMMELWAERGNDQISLESYKHPACPGSLCLILLAASLSYLHAWCWVRSPDPKLPSTDTTVPSKFHHNNASLLDFHVFKVFLSTPLLSQGKYAFE